jgi:hypothetical protein
MTYRKPCISPRVPVIGSKPILRDRRGDEMTVISASIPWVEAQDQSCKGSAEKRKSATASRLLDFRSRKSQDNNTMTIRNTPVIYFRKNRPAHKFPRSHTRESTASNPASDKKTCEKQPKRGPGQRQTWLDRGSEIPHWSSTPRSSLMHMHVRISPRCEHTEMPH